MNVLYLDIRKGACVFERYSYEANIFTYDSVKDFKMKFKNFYSDRNIDVHCKPLAILRDTGKYSDDTRANLVTEFPSEIIVDATIDGDCLTIEIYGTGDKLVEYVQVNTNFMEVNMKFNGFSFNMSALYINNTLKIYKPMGGILGSLGFKSNQPDQTIQYTIPVFWVNASGDIEYSLKDAKINYTVNKQ